MWAFLRKTSIIIHLVVISTICLCASASDETPLVPTVSINPINLTTMPIMIPHTLITPFPTTQPVHEGPWIFSGQVLRGASWEAAEPGERAVVECYCSDDPRETGHLVGSAVTGSAGNYTIMISETCRFYTLYTLSPLSESVPDADSVSGTVLPSGVIRFEEPLYGKNLAGNRFFFSTGEVVASASPSGSPVPAGTRFAPDTPLPGVLVILALVAGFIAIVKKGSNR